QSQLELVENTLGTSLHQVEEILEIGAGNANFSILMRSRSQTKLSLDVCEPGDQWLEHYTFHKIHRVAEFFPFSGKQKYDYIHTSHWLEHMDDLASTIRDLKDLLKPGAFLFVEVPNCEHDYWNAPELDTPHIQFFTQDSLKRGFEKAGFDCLSIGEYGITFIEYRKGVKVTQDKFGPRDKGFWLRAIFQKKA
ncbi:MAG: class I SAM-dependent methyltransferase, partial [Bacteroidota bacterium]